MSCPQLSHVVPPSESQFAFEEARDIRAASDSGATYVRNLRVQNNTDQDEQNFKIVFLLKRRSERTSNNPNVNLSTNGYVAICQVLRLAWDPVRLSMFVCLF